MFILACCAVDFFGPIQGLEAHWSRLPPALILHGGKDKVVAPEESARLLAMLAAAGKTEGLDYHFTSYPEEGHGFKGKALAQSRDEAVQFIRKSMR